MFIELTDDKGKKFLYDPDSGWEIFDKGMTTPAHWVNHKLGRNLNATETYTEIKSKLLK